MTILKKWSGDGLSTGNVSTSTAGTGDDAFDAVPTSPVATIVATGTRSPQMQVQNTGSGGYVYWGITAQSAGAGRFYFTTPSSWPSAAVPIGGVVFNSVTLSMNVAISGTGAPGQLRLYNGGTQLQATAASTLSNSTRYRIEWTITHGAGATGTATVKCYLDDSLTEVASLTQGSTNYQASHNRVFFGYINASPNAGAAQLDDMAAADAAGLIGPVVTSTPATGTAALTLSGSTTGTAAASSTAALSLTGSGTARATAASSTASLTLTGTGTAADQRPATGTATLTITGTASTATTGAGAGSLTLTGTATPKATAAGAGTLTLTATGGAGDQRAASGDATLTLTATNTATGTRATGTAALTLTGTGAAPTAATTSVGTLDLTATLTEITATGVGTASLDLTATIAATTGEAAGTATLELLGIGTASSADNYRDITVTARLVPTTYRASLTPSAYTARIGDTVIVGSTIYQHVALTADHDISADTVRISLNGGVDWYDLDHVAGTTDSTWRILIGEGQPLDPAGDATALVQINDDPEVVIVNAGRFYVTTA